jgi:hypothetical protein
VNRALSFQDFDRVGTQRAAAVRTIEVSVEAHLRMAGGIACATGILHRA